MPCVECAYYSGNKCHWFEETKDIPEDVISQGCNFFVNKLGHPLLNYAIIMFNGRII